MFKKEKSVSSLLLLSSLPMPRSRAILFLALVLGVVASGPLRAIETELGWAPALKTWGLPLVALGAGVTLALWLGSRR